jgi:hypothetical protein
LEAHAATDREPGCQGPEEWGEDRVSDETPLCLCSPQIALLGAVHCTERDHEANSRPDHSALFPSKDSKQKTCIHIHLGFNHETETSILSE